MQRHHDLSLIPLGLALISRRVTGLYSTIASATHSVLFVALFFFFFSSVTSMAVYLSPV